MFENVKTLLNLSKIHNKSKRLTKVYQEVTTNIDHLSIVTPDVDFRHYMSAIDIITGQLETLNRDLKKDLGIFSK